MTLDLWLSFGEHILKLSRVCFHQLRQLRRIRKSLPDHIAQQLVHTFVTCRFDYCNSILYGLPDSHTRRLQAVLNSAARLVSGAGRFDHISRSSNPSTGYPTPNVLHLRSTYWHIVLGIGLPLSNL